MKSFADLQLSEPLCQALEKEKYSVPTEIQEQSIPHLMEGGDLLGSAQTGTGKTAAFALPVLEQISKIGKRPRRREVRALVLVPTRELAEQVCNSFNRYGRFTKCHSTAVFGGVGYVPQVKALRSGVDVLVATPGRLLDLFEAGHLDLEYVKHFIMDEADRMLDMGFKDDLERIIVELPEDRQTMLFSATMHTSIVKLAKKILNNPKRVSISPTVVTADNINEQVIFVKPENKNKQLLELLEDDEIGRAIVFTRTKRMADQLSKKLNTKRMKADAIHGDKRQNARQRSLAKFKKGKVRILVATDVAARGIDVDGITHVFNYELSDEPENYVHRIGRTARAGKNGTAITLCDPNDRGMLLSVQRLLKRKLEVNEVAEYHNATLAARCVQEEKPKSKRRKRGGRPSSRSSSAKGNSSNRQSSSKRRGKAQEDRASNNSSPGGKAGAKSKKRWSNAKKRKRTSGSKASMSA